MLTEAVQVLVELFHPEIQDLYNSGLNVGSLPALKSVAAKTGQMPGMPRNFNSALDAIPTGRNFEKVVGFLDFHRAWIPEFKKAMNGGDGGAGGRGHDPRERRRPGPGGPLRPATAPRPALPGTPRSTCDLGGHSPPAAGIGAGRLPGVPPGRRRGVNGGLTFGRKCLRSAANPLRLAVERVVSKSRALRARRVLHRRVGERGTHAWG